MIYLLFFLSGFSALIYQLVWVRVFGNVFGNTVYSASLVVAVFMLGLGAGSYIAGLWADRRYAAGPTRRDPGLLRTYSYVEFAIALLAIGILTVLPHLADLVVSTSSYSRNVEGWYVLSWPSYGTRVAVAILLLTPITLLMGGTLTLLIRHLVRHDLERAGWRIAVLYGVNTGGAALGALLTDFVLVPSYGLRQTQWLAVVVNVAAGAGALYLAARTVPAALGGSARMAPHLAEPAPRKRSRVGRVPRSGPGNTVPRDEAGVLAGRDSPVVLVSLALFLSGFAAMGMEILWFRHFSILLGGFRAVFSLLLTVILAGIAIGSLLGGALERRTRRAAECLMLVQGLFVAATLAGLGLADASGLDAQIAAARVAVTQGASVAMPELLFNLLPILFEVGPAAMLMGFSFPLANAVIQRTESDVGRRAGALYFANTAGAVCGSLAAGFLLLPALGIQDSATALMILTGLSGVALYAAVRRDAAPRRAGVGALLTAAAALAIWTTLPADHVLARALPRPLPGERVIAVDEGVTEVISITERAREGRALYTNGHSMSSTAPRAQRYMRALAHVPLLSIDGPRSVLVIGFGVGNTTHAATLHPSIERVDVADLSPAVLEQAGYFSDANRGVLKDPRATVYVNDGRHHLQMQPPGSYDLITLEPPPPGYAGMAALYSREFYAIARTRLRPNGYLSQWLPAYQVPTDSVLAMVRAFVDVFPQSVLISGAESELLLLGTAGQTIEIDPEHVAARLAAAPHLAADLARLDLAGIREIAGSFVASAPTLVSATRDVAPVTDDRPTQEYGSRSLLNLGTAVPASLVDLGDIDAWCPKCFADGPPAPLARGLDTYVQLMQLAYAASPSEVAAVRETSVREGRVIAGSAYLGSIVPESEDLHNILGIASASEGDIDGALVEFRKALQLAPDSAATHWHLGAALAARGARQEAIVHLRRSVEIDPRNEFAQNDLRALLAAPGDP